MNPQSCFLRSFLYLVVSTGAAQIVNISYKSQGYPDFYLNNQITFICTASGFTDIVKLELRYNGGSSVSSSGCTKNLEGPWGSIGPPLINEVTGIEGPSITTAYCTTIAKPRGFTVEVKVSITDTSIRGKFYCRGFQSGAVNSSTVEITDIKVVPANLMLTIYPNNTSVFEGEEFNFTCTSDDSLAQFDYKLNGKTVTTKSYTPAVSDRGGITIKCTDKGHSRIQGGSIERLLMPVFSEGNAGNMDCTKKRLVLFNLILALCLVM